MVTSPVDFTQGYFVVAILFSEHTSLQDKVVVSCFFLHKQFCLKRRTQTFHPLEFVQTASWQHAHFTCPHPPSPLGKSTAFPMRTVLPPQRDWEEFLCPCRSFQTLWDDKKIFVRVTPASWSSALVSEELKEYWLVTSCEAPRADSLRPLLLQHLISFHRFRKASYTYNI